MRGVVTTITDFAPNKAVLVMPLEFQSSNGSVDVPITFEIVQADDGTYTDLFFSRRPRGDSNNHYDDRNNTLVGHHQFGG